MNNQEQSQRNLYKSIVLYMSLCIPVGVAFGLMYLNFPLGLFLGNTTGLLLGITVNFVRKKEQ